jgi:hypothetical protein
VCGVGETAGRADFGDEHRGERGAGPGQALHDVEAGMVRQTRPRSHPPAVSTSKS